MRIEQWLGQENQLGIDIWHKKYQQNNETFEEWLDRISAGNEEIRQLIVDKKFLFGGRILSNRGMNKHGKKVTYSNCYVIAPPEDNIESIFEAASKLARTFSYGGGCGLDISKLAPRGAIINNTAKATTGSVSFMDLYNLITELIGQNGRRAALMLSLSCDHPDLEEFISVKNDLNKITKANISIRITNEFMEAVVQKKHYNLTFVRQETGEEIVKNVYAPDIFRQLCENNWNFGEPGMLYWDTIENYNMLSQYDNFKFAGVNPCAEQPLPAGGSCLLGSLNLAAFVNNGVFDMEGFCDAVGAAVRALNEVLDEGLALHPLKEQQESVADWRQIGLGIFGLADMLIKMGIEYGSEEAVIVCDDIGDMMAYEAMTSSAMIAKEKGAFPKFDKEALFNSPFYKEHRDKTLDTLIDNFGMRNSQILTVAPTGSLSTMLGVSGGIEPIFDTHYTRKTESLHGHEEYYIVYTPIVKEYMVANDVTDVNQLPGYFTTAKKIKGKDRIAMQAVWQKHIDASISSTVNIPESATVEDVEDLYISAWKAGLKGLTIFRENCARLSILTSGDKPKTEEKEEMILDTNKETVVKLDTLTPKSRDELGTRLNGSTYIKEIACGKLYITINRDKDNNLVEVFIDPGKSGGCSANAECIGRYASACMRCGMSIEAIVDVTKGVKCSACTQAKGAKKKKIDGLSCGDVIARTIQEEYNLYHNKNKEVKEIEVEPVVEETEKKEFDSAQEKMINILGKTYCPECGNEIANSGGCTICLNCGYSKCD